MSRASNAQGSQRILRECPRLNSYLAAEDELEKIASGSEQIHSEGRETSGYDRFGSLERAASISRRPRGVRTCACVAQVPRDDVDKERWSKRVREAGEQAGCERFSVVGRGTRPSDPPVDSLGPVVRVTSLTVRCFHLLDRLR